MTGSFPESRPQASKEMFKVTLLETLDLDFKAALKAKDETGLSTLRLLKTAIKNKQVDLRRTLTEAEVLGVVSSQVKQRRDSISQYRSGSREDLAAREEAELKILEAYLPSRLSPEETVEALEKVIAELGAATAKDAGRVMKTVMSRHAGQIDGKLAQEILKKRLT